MASVMIAVKTIFRMWLATCRLAIRRRALLLARNAVWRADEWVYAQEVRLRDEAARTDFRAEVDPVASAARERSQKRAARPRLAKPHTVRYVAKLKYVAGQFVRTVPMLALAAAFACAPAKAQQKTVNREFLIETSALAGAWTMDTISTDQRFHWCDRHYGTRLGYQPDCFENGGFFNGTRDTAKSAGAWAAVDIAAVAVSYEWKRHVRNKYLHPLWRVPLIVGAVGHTRAAIGNWGR